MMPRGPPQVPRRSCSERTRLLHSQRGKSRPVARSTAKYQILRAAPVVICDNEPDLGQIVGAGNADRCPRNHQPTLVDVQPPPTRGAASSIASLFPFLVTVAGGSLVPHLIKTPKPEYQVQHHLPADEREIGVLRTGDHHCPIA